MVEKKAYRAPRLKTHGSIQDLTGDVPIPGKNTSTGDTLQVHGVTIPAQGSDWL